MTNTRFKNINESVEGEALAQNTILSWDFRNVLNSSVTFKSEWHYRITGTENYFGLPEPDGSVRISLEEILAFGPDANGTTPEAVMFYLKWLFDQAHNAKRGPNNVVAYVPPEPEPPQPEPEPEPEPPQP